MWLLLPPLSELCVLWLKPLWIYLFHASQSMCDLDFLDRGNLNWFYLLLLLVVLSFLLYFFDGLSL